MSYVDHRRQASVGYKKTLPAAAGAPKSQRVNKKLMNIKEMKSPE